MLDSVVTVILSSDWSVLFVVGGILLLSTELGFRIGRRHTAEYRKSRYSPSGALQGALLGLLGLLLGFTFAMAVGRFDTRKTMVLDESNAIGTAWLRAGFLNEPAKGIIRASLMDYIEARLAGAAVQAGSPAYQETLARSEKNQAAMWRATVAELKVNNTPSSSLFAASLNDLIDMDAKRQAALRNQVPRSVWLLLMLVSFTVCIATGYTTGLGESGRFTLAMIILPILLTIVITIISDLDNPHIGLIQVSQRSMLDLQQTLQKYQ